MNNFVEYQNELIKINDAASLNPKEFVLKAEYSYHEDINNIAKNIVNNKKGCKLIMLSGPSSSGKTTTSNLLKDALEKNGIGSTIISLDDFYRGEKQAPILPNGQHDYECVEALNIDEIKKCLLNLVNTNSCVMPIFNFETHTPFPYKRTVTLNENDIAIVEGLHALNPIFRSELPDKGVCKIYISVKQGIISSGRELFTANGMRLIRRIVRDYNFRGAKPERTLEMWPNVMVGERKYIKPFRPDADYTINSLHAYETCVLLNQAIPILKTVDSNDQQYSFCQRLIEILKEFVPINSEFVPKNSIIREFIGGGIY
jgi:uridine kinase